MKEQDVTRQEAPTKVLEEDIASLIELARKSPGVSEVMEAYEKYEPVAGPAQKYFAMMRPRFVLSVSDGTST